jgi:hypothetical protein
VSAEHGQYLAIRRVFSVLRSDHMQSCSAANGQEDVRKKEKRYKLDMAKLYPFPTVYRTYLLYWDVRRAFFIISFSNRRCDDEEGRFVRLSLGELPSGRGKAQPSETLKTLECVTALLFFQAVYFSARARAHKTTVGTPNAVQSLRVMFSRCCFSVCLVNFDNVLACDGSEWSSVWTLSMRHPQTFSDGRTTPWCDPI